MNVIAALEAMEAAPQGNARLEALRKNDSPALRRMLHLALSPDVTFGVKQLPVPLAPPPEVYEEFPSDQEWHDQLLPLLERLSERQLTGNKAQYEIAAFLGYCNEPQLKWSERILKQDLRINVGAKDVNKALGEQAIYLFEVPLATDIAKVKPKDLKGRWTVQPKLDGGRAVAVLPGPGKRVKLLSRTGKEWGNFESVRLALQEANDRRVDQGVLYVDGEVVSYVDGKIDFQAAQKTMMRKDGQEVGTLRFVVFDAAYESEWKRPVFPYSERLAFAAEFVEFVGNPGRVEVITNDSGRGFYVAGTRESGTVKFEYTDPELPLIKECEQHWVGLGYEGAMVRRLDLPIENKRGKRLLKVKSFIDEEARIEGWTEGTGKYKGMLGAWLCRTTDGKLFEIGSGYSDKQRAEFWRTRETRLGALVNFKYFERTDDGIPRFPIFRYFRSEEDVS